MTSERWERIEEIFQAALARPAAERGAFVSEQCRGDDALRLEVESLLSATVRAGSFMDTPAMQMAARALTEGESRIAAGRMVGAYRLLSRLGAGGMGEVWLACDTRVDRDVAIKFCDGQFTQRIEREARAIAALNHPNICQLYDVGPDYLVMELVEGESPQGPLPVETALDYARQIGHALEAAHEKGIVHRDLKPGNIKVRNDGTVKVLDFGLAKALGPTVAGDVSMSPALSMAVSQAGMILGTAPYMAPEQARGKPADKRADVWAFGCVLYEMLAGKRAFDGEDVAVVLASVIQGEPDWAAVPANVPLPIVILLRGCLEREPHKRIADMGTASFVLNHAAQLVQHVVERVEMPAIAAAPGAARWSPMWRRAAWMAAGISVGALLAGVGVRLLTRPTPPAVVRMTVMTYGSAALMLSSADPDVAITPDGSRVVYRGNSQLLVRALDQLEPTVLIGAGSPHGVFISPNGKWVGFFDGDNSLKKVAITGGPPVTVCAVRDPPRGATWGEDGSIIFATNSLFSGLLRVSAAGGQPSLLTTLERGDTDHLWPEFLPGGEAVLFTIAPATGTVENAQIAVRNLKTSTSKVLINGGSHAHYVPTGHLVYGVAGTLRAVAFDLGRLEVVGTPTTVLEGLVTTAEGAADIAVAANGSLVYVPGGAGAGGQRTIVSVDRQGRASPLPGLPPDSYRDVRVSPDGARLALATQADVWTYDLVRATLTRLTTHSASDTRPLWTPDGQRIVFSSNRAGYPELFWRPADGTGSDERLLARAKEILDLRADTWSADGKQLLFSEVPPDFHCAIGQIAIERPSDAKVLMKSEFCPSFAAVSPDGRWMAYHARVSGRPEIYVERYPELGNRQQISTSGGTKPLWSRTGRELFFSSLNGRQMLAVPVQSGTTLVAGRPRVLFEFAMFMMLGGRPYDIAPDGRFLIIRGGQEEAVGGTASNMIMVLNWFEELKRLVRTN